MEDMISIRLKLALCDLEDRLHIACRNAMVIKLNCRMYRRVNNNVKWQCHRIVYNSINNHTTKITEHIEKYVFK